MKFGKPTGTEIKTVKGKKLVRFRFSFASSTQSVEFEMTFDGAMMIMKGLQQIQATHKIPIPRQVRARGKPKLSVVPPEE